MNEITWYIPQEVWHKIPTSVQERFDETNRLVPYRISPGQGKTWIKTQNFGYFYAWRGDLTGIPDLYWLVPELPNWINEWRIRHNCSPIPTNFLTQ